jgi:hypothetical protein
MESLEFEGMTLVPVPEQSEESCNGCVAFTCETNQLCDDITDLMTGHCLGRGIIWVHKESIQKTVEMNRFFGRTITEQIEMFPETLAVTQEEDEAWQAQQKSVATGVTDGTLSKANYIKAIGTDPLSVQVGGGHYKSMAIQPVEYITKNNLPYCEANVIKYISRWREKGGKKDLEKAKHYIDMLIQLENL